uniref:Poly [ADP-ribose] polymerase n=1 Tax=Globodera rostochiensis TaxID=31243 RepID=A0A914H4K5_GLORO
MDNRGMPLLMITGYPSCGKSTICARIFSYFEEHNLGENLYIVSDEGIDSNFSRLIYDDLKKEKEVRSALRAKVQRLLDKKSLVICDSTNHIKGYRYELYCLAKNTQTRFAVIHCKASFSTCKWLNAQREDTGRYSDSILFNLLKRFEAPEQKNRWDSPLFEINIGGESAIKSIEMRDEFGIITEDANDCALAENFGKMSETELPRNVNLPLEQIYATLVKGKELSANKCMKLQIPQILDRLLALQRRATVGDTLTVLDGERGHANGVAFSRIRPLPQLSRLRHQFAMSNFQIVWEYQCSPAKWVEFERGLATFLDGFLNDSGGSGFEFEGRKVIFDLRLMRQCDSEGRVTRNIRCAVRPTGGGAQVKFVWSYQYGPRKRWISFPADLSLKLEEKFGCVSPTKIVRDQKMEFTLNEGPSQIMRRGKYSLINEEGTAKIKNGRSLYLEKDKEKMGGSEGKVERKVMRKMKVDEVEEEVKRKKEAGEVVEVEVKRKKKAEEVVEVEVKRKKKAEEVVEVEVKRKKVEEEVKRKKKKAEEVEEEVKRKEKAEEIEHLDENESKLNGVQSDVEVDAECRELRATVRVYVDEKGRCYDVMLNQTDIHQNNNKFYLMQLLCDITAKDKIWLWRRWGRVGFRGQSNLIPFGSEFDGALTMFLNKFSDKTRNDFLEGTENFQKVAGKYDLIKIDHDRRKATEKKIGVKLRQNVSPTESKALVMDDRVRALLTTICDLKAMECDARRLEYDFKRIPLGKITKEQLNFGYEALSRIERQIQKANFGREFVEAMNDYYTRIPHSFGMRTPPPIKSPEELNRETELLEMLTGIEITVANIGGDPLECHYARLRWNLIPLEREDENYKIVEEYLRETHGPTHDRYQLKLRNVFEFKPKGTVDGKRAEGIDGTRKEIGVGNRKLLWHGSHLANWYSILAQGLRIAPPEAPSTGFMFGKGVYFADISSKSANYSLCDPDKPGFLLLSDVALGEVLDLKEADSNMHKKLPEGKNSVKGVGRYVPLPNGGRKIDGNVEVPCGKPTQNAELDAEDETSLIYNEFVVYNLDQIRERFLVEVEYIFDFKL